MKISVLGSWRDESAEWPMHGTHSDFVLACYEIGRELGKVRQEIVVGGQSEFTADFHIVSGMVDELKGQNIATPLIEVLRPRGDTSAYKEMAQQNPQLFSFHIPTQAKWTEAHLMSLQESDVVLTIAGMKGTYQAGLAAIVAKKKLIPVACFGGAAAKLSTALEAMVEPQRRSDFRRLNGPWSRQSIDLIMKLIGRATLPRVLIVHGRAPDWMVLREWLKGSAALQEVRIMREEFSAGESLPEKFERLASSVDKTIVLATPDDLGGLVDSNHSTFLPRARQNVWLELGWFWGRLGRNNLMLLRRGGTEIPSDLSGLEFYTYHQEPIELSDKLRSFLDLRYARNQ